MVHLQTTATKPYYDRSYLVRNGRKLEVDQKYGPSATRWQGRH